MKRRIIIGLLAVIVIVAAIYLVCRCADARDKPATVEVADRFYEYLQKRDFYRAQRRIGFNGSPIVSGETGPDGEYEMLVRRGWKHTLADLSGKLGDVESYELVGWKRAGWDSGWIFELSYRVVYGKCKADETILIRGPKDGGFKRLFARRFDKVVFEE